MTPRAENRVWFDGESTDAHGMPRMRFDYLRDERDLSAVASAAVSINSG